MKKLAAILVLLVVFGVLGYLFRDTVTAQTSTVVFYSQCDQPKTYSLGQIDPEFNLTQQEFVQVTNEAAAIWNKAAGKTILSYSAEAKMPINLLYDKRQTLNMEINQQNQKLKEEDSSLQPRIDAYNRRSKEVQEKIKNLNQDIEASNQQGGATKEEYQALITRQKVLREETTALNAEADSLSISTDTINAEIDKLGSTVDTYNDALHAKPEGGKYIRDEKGERIEINLYDNRQELVHILAHELGHSLGMEHVSDTQAIMFLKTNGLVIPTQEDIRQLTIACRQRNRVEEKVDIIATNLNLLLAKFSAR